VSVRRAVRPPRARRALKRGTYRLRPRARIIRAIGEDLISNPIIAVVELIKNAYDADAKRVTVTFRSPLRAGEGAIVVSDDGYGIDPKTLKTAWFEPATISKRKVTRSPGGRRVTGEKGLGRFAAARLAEHMRLESIHLAGKRRVTAQFDWGDFKQDERYLDQIRCKWAEYGSDADAASGTILTLERLRSDWNRDQLETLRGELARLVVPDANDFSIQLELPSAFSDLAGEVLPPRILERPKYTLGGSISAEGRLLASMTIIDKASQVDEVLAAKGGSQRVCGPFRFDFKVWDRDDLEPLAGQLGSTVRDLKRDLNAICGVSIYRDGFRVLPYGSKGVDWLDLDIRRVQSPTMRLSSNQIVGAIHIAADENPGLRDQTNREGLVDSAAFDHLKETVRAILMRLQVARYASRRAPGPRTSPGALFEALDLEPVRESFQQRYPDDKEFLAFLQERSQVMHASVDQVRQVLVRYRRLSTLGQLIDMVLHEGRTPVASISNQCLLAKREIKGKQTLENATTTLEKRLDTIAAQAEVLTSLFRRLAPLGGRRRTGATDVAMEQLIAEAFDLFKREVDKLGVRVSLPKGNTLLRVDPTDVQQILVNLLDNALHWLAQVAPEHRAISVECAQRSTSGVEIIFSDSGPGVPEGVRELIFDPYFSTKPDGIGLGLSIAGEIASEHSGSLELLEPGLLPGARFRVLLNGSVPASA
jgi:signal transduction histidine kinase